MCEYLQINTVWTKLTVAKSLSILRICTPCWGINRTFVMVESAHSGACVCVCVCAVLCFMPLIIELVYGNINKSFFHVIGYLRRRDNALFIIAIITTGLCSGMPLSIHDFQLSLFFYSRINMWVADTLVYTN